MKCDYSFMGTVQKFPGTAGWIYIVVPMNYTKELKQKRRAWGMYPIVAGLGPFTWETKLMMKKGGDFFIALKKSIRDKHPVTIGKKVAISFTLK